MCRLGAIELTKTYSILEKKYPGAIKVFGFGPDDLGLDEFKSLNIFSQPIFVPVEGFDFYKIFQFKKPGFLKCYGFCNKGIIKRTDDLKKVNYNAGYTFSGDLAQLGGSFIVNKKGIAIYSKLDNFLGDHATQDEVIYQFDLLLRYREFESVEKREDSYKSSNANSDSKESNEDVYNTNNKDIIKTQDNKEKLSFENNNKNEKLEDNEKFDSQNQIIIKENKEKEMTSNLNKDLIIPDNISIIDKKDTVYSKNVEFDNKSSI